MTVWSQQVAVACSYNNSTELLGYSRVIVTVIVRRLLWMSRVLIGCEHAGNSATTSTVAFAARTAFWDTASPLIVIRRSSGSPS